MATLSLSSSRLSSSSLLPHHPVISIRDHRPQALSTSSTNHPDTISTASPLLWSPWFYVKCQGWTHPINVLVTMTLSRLSSSPMATAWALLLASATSTLVERVQSPAAWPCAPPFCISILLADNAPRAWEPACVWLSTPNRRPPRAIPTLVSLAFVLSHHHRLASVPL